MPYTYNGIDLVSLPSGRFEIPLIAKEAESLSEATDIISKFDWNALIEARDEVRTRLEYDFVIYMYDSLGFNDQICMSSKTECMTLWIRSVVCRWGIKLKKR